MAKNDWAIVVGVQSYPGLGDLKGPENDAKAFYKWVCSPSGGKVPKRHAKLILSSDYKLPFISATDAEPTHVSVQKAFDNLHDLSEENMKNGEGQRVGRRLYIFLAGHGFAPRSDQTALLTANAMRSRVGYHILGEYNADWLWKAGYFSEVFLFMDCCRETYPTPALQMTYGEEIVDQNAFSTAKFFYAFGTKWSRLSRERVMDDGLVHGVFTTALLAGLEGAAVDPSDASGRITADSLRNYLYNNMKKFLKPDDLRDPTVPKEPDIEYKPQHVNTFVVTKVPVRIYPVAIHVPASSQGKRAVIRAHGLDRVASIDAVPATWQVDLRPGRYLVEIPVDGLESIFEVGGTGGTLDVQI